MFTYNILIKELEFTNLQTENILKMAHCVFYHTKNPFPLHVYKMVLAKKQWWGIIINKKKILSKQNIIRSILNKVLILLTRWH